MNDFLFLLIESNLAPGRSETVIPWFAVTPNEWRSALTAAVARASGQPPADMPFLFARLLTSLTFLGLALRWTWRAASSQSGTEWCQCVFLTVAWFWLLSPTQNPWYWTWALPFLPFARARAWRLMSGMCFVYYLRFWFGEMWPEAPVWGTHYNGHQFFDFVVVWMEYAPWYALLVWEGCRSADRKELTTTNQLQGSR